MKKLKLGIIGLSKGNGHPYSWSAIFNGYDPKFMGNCPFPAIPEYLSKQKYPSDTIKNARITHIWTQNKKMSLHIAKSSKIENVVAYYPDMIGKVDAILLARDDSENHYKISKPFIEARMPIYIDKPLATTVNDAKKIFNLEKYPGQIFSCSALSHAKEFQITEQTKKQIGKIQHIDAIVMKDWKKYGIHIVEPVLKIIGKQEKIKQINVTGKGNHKIVVVKWTNQLTTTFTTLGKIPSPITIRIFGEKKHIHLDFKDTFFAFKKALQTFINIIQKKENPISKKFILNVIKIVEKGSK